MSQSEYDNILYYNLVFKMEGFKNRLDYQEIINRKMAYSSFIGPRFANAKKAMKIDELWPLSGEDSKKKGGVTLADKRRAIQEYLKSQNENNG